MAELQARALPVADRDVSIETDRVLNRGRSHFGVIDVGSNSMRLVVYDDLARAPFPRFNEKSVVALGAGIDDDGNFTDTVMARAMRAIRRFHAIARAMGVEALDIIATEAMRRAKNGQVLVDAITEETGCEVNLLSGGEEATHSAHGVIFGFFQPQGIVGDIGGGSLELAQVTGDRVEGSVTSMPLGALPVKHLMEDGVVDSAKKEIDRILADQVPDFPRPKVFYAVGGGWRALARIHIATHDLPIRVVHGYELPGDTVRALAKKIARLSPDEVADLPDVPSRRVDTLPASALVMSRVLKALKPERVIFSVSGVREGWLYSKLDETEQYRDPLLESAMAIGLPRARVPGFSAALGDWTEGLFPDETLPERRLRLTACALTDLSWRDHEKVRAQESFYRILHFPFIGVTHPERVFIALTLLARYGGKLDDALTKLATDYLDPETLNRAEVLGRALLLGHRYSASVPEILAQTRLVIEDDTVVLEVDDPESAPDSDAVRTRLRQLVKVAGADHYEVIVTSN
ncbi:MAG: Ppx/GppA phosphatase family protein [Pseudomonadota bacterium]